VLAGEPVGVKAEGGFVDFMTREVEVECLPGNIPEHIEVNIAHLHLHQSIKVGDIVPPEGVKLNTDPAAALVIIQVPHKEEAEVKKEEEEVVEEAKEPEVIKKERAPEEKEE
jgi:large subunit ribosomal protein L25